MKKLLLTTVTGIAMLASADDSSLGWFDPGKPRAGEAAAPDRPVTVKVEWAKPLLRIPPRFYGINIHPLSAAEGFRNRGLLAALKPDTMRLMLTGRTSWIKVNGETVVVREPLYPEPGKFNLTEIDALIDGVKSVGAEPYITLGFGAPPWLNTANGPKFGLPKREDIPAYADFKAELAELVLKRHPEVKMLAIENEPENVKLPIADYVLLYRLAAEKIRRAAPGIRIAGPATGYAVWKQPDGSAPSFGDAIARLHREQVKFDAFDWHIYSTSPQRVFDSVGVIRRVYGDTIPLILSELNLDWRYSGSGGEASKKNNTSWYSAVYLAETFDGLQRLGVERVYYFCLRNNFFGMYDYHFTKVHPAFHVFRMFTSELGRERVEASTDHGAVGAIATADRRALLVYNRSDAEVKIRLDGASFPSVSAYSETWYESNKGLDGENFHALPATAPAPGREATLPPRGILLFR